MALEWISPEPVSTELELAVVALEALEALREVVEPLAANLALVCSDREDRWPVDFDGCPLHPFWYLRTRTPELSDSIQFRPMYKNAKISETSQLDRESLEAWIELALAQKCNSLNAIVAWAELWIQVSSARLFREYSQPVFFIHGETGRIDVPIQMLRNARWVSGPVVSAVTQPPIDLAFRSQGGVISLKIHIHWSWWTEIGSPERHAVDDALDVLRSSGWELISTDLE